MHGAGGNDEPLFGRLFVFISFRSSEEEILSGDDVSTSKEADLHNVESRMKPYSAP